VGPGPLIRRTFGPYEHWATEKYRGIFVDLDALVDWIRDSVAQPRRILEIGCGEGAVTERLVTAFPSAAITATDISPSVGRLFRGPSGQVTFLRQSVDEIVERSPHAFDLVIMSDVLHHVPVSERRRLLYASREAMSPGGSFVFKDWAPSFHPIHWLCRFSDRYITGDDVHFCTRDALAALLTEVFGPGAIREQLWISPWANNVAFLLRV
jgi:2-polyprenyl-3-methyl-5-hydroxy-6-metoxy-1,4-benzoquinol methylase